MVLCSSVATFNLNALPLMVIGEKPPAYNAGEGYHPTIIVTS